MSSEISLGRPYAFVSTGLGLGRGLNGGGRMPWV